MYIEKESTKKAKERLSAGSPGDVLLAADMGLVLAMRCDSSNDLGWRIVARAIIAVEKTCDLFWRWNREEKSWRCLTDAEKPNELKLRRSRIRRQAKRSRRVGSSCDLSSLSETDRAEVAVGIVLAGAIELMAGGRIAKKLTSVVREAYIPSEQVLLDACQKRLT